MKVYRIFLNLLVAFALIFTEAHAAVHEVPVVYPQQFADRDKTIAAAGVERFMQSARLTDLTPAGVSHRFIGTLLSFSASPQEIPASSISPTVASAVDAIASPVAGAPQADNVLAQSIAGEIDETIEVKGEEGFWDKHKESLILGLFALLALMAGVVAILASSSGSGSGSGSGGGSGNNGAGGGNPPPGDPGSNGGAGGEDGSLTEETAGGAGAAGGLGAGFGSGAGGGGSAGAGGAGGGFAGGAGGSFGGSSGGTGLGGGSFAPGSGLGGGSPFGSQGAGAGGGFPGGQIPMNPEPSTMLLTGLGLLIPYMRSKRK